MSDIAASTVNPVTATTPTLLTPASAGASSTSLLPPTSAASAPLSVNTSTAVAAAIPPTGSLTIPTSINSPGELVPAGQSTSLTTTANSNANTSTTNTNATTAANTYNNGYGTGAGMYGGGYGMDPYGMGGMYGMNGLGMMGMGMLGMTPEAQRSQMMMFMISRMVELWGMFSQVIQGAFVSVIQFADNYVSIHQRVGALEDEAMSQEEQFRRKEYETNKEMKDLPITDRIALREHKKQRHARPSTLRRIAWTTFRHAVIFLVAYFIAKKISAWWQARQDNNLLEEVAHKVAGFDG